MLMSARTSESNQVDYNPTGPPHPFCIELLYFPTPPQTIHDTTSRWLKISIESRRPSERHRTDSTRIVDSL